MRLLLRTYLFFTFLLTMFLSFGNDRLKEGKELFEAKQYKQSLAIYESLIDSTNHSANLYYNLALCHKELGNLGLSLWYVEKALLYQPYHQQSNALLAQQNELVNDDLDLATEFSAFNKVSRGVDASFMYLLGFVFSIVAALFLFFGIKKKKSSFYFFTLLAILFAGATMFMLWVRKATFEDSGYGIVMENCILKEKDDSESNDSFSVSEGLKLQIIGEEKDWFKVQVKQQDAYIPKSYLKKI